LEEEITHGRAVQIRRHVSRRSIQQRRSASLARESGGGGAAGSPWGREGCK